MKSDRVSGTEMLLSSLPRGGVKRIMPSAQALSPTPVKSKQTPKQIKTKKERKTPLAIW